MPAPVAIVAPALPAAATPTLAAGPTLGLTPLTAAASLTPIPAHPSPTLAQPGAVASNNHQATPLPGKTPTSQSVTSLELLAGYPGMALTTDRMISVTPSWGVAETIGYSVQGRAISRYRFGDGPVSIVFIGGMHGGYEWNTILLAYAAVDYFSAYPAAVPPIATLSIIPSANPDGQFLVTEQAERFSNDDVTPDTFAGRFNAHGVDLNRNWDCNWSADALWRDQSISGGRIPFSEPESQALRDFLLAQAPVAVVFWHSAAGGVFASGCPEPFPPAWQLAKLYGEAANYPVYDAFRSYPITGDAGDWLSLQGIPAITVELATHDDLEWSRNLAGMVAVMNFYSRLDG